MPKIFTILIFFLSINNLFSQNKKKSRNSTIDSTYIQTFPKYIMGRVYTSRKFTNLTFENISEGRKLNYEPNTTLNFGVGATIKSFTLNLAYGFKFLNKDGLNKGKTRYLDLQSHIYKRKFLVDLFGQIYNGLYLDNSNFYFKDSLHPYYLRPDINIRLFGFRALIVRNSSRFSYSAPFVQNELQKKSAGSFLYGVAATAFFSRADSNYVPHFVNDSLYKSYYNNKQMQTIQFGPDIGYAYSLIIWKKIFITASADLAFMIGKVNYHSFNGVNKNQWQVNTALSGRFAMGYNSENWYLGLSVLQGNTSLKSIDKKGQLNVGVGNVRLNYVKRFKVERRHQKIFDYF